MRGCRFENPLLYAPGQVALTPSMTGALEIFVPLVLDRPCTLVVEGHAQPSEVGAGPARSAHEVALRRALLVLRKLIDLGFPAARLVVAAVEEAPVDPAAIPEWVGPSPLLDAWTPEEIDRNQRSVEIWVYPTG